MATAGKDMKVYITEAASNSAEWVAGEQTSSLNLSADMVEISDKNTAWKKYLPTMKGGTLDVTVYADTHNHEQARLITSLMDGERVNVFVGQLEDAGDLTGSKSGFMFDAYVTSISESYETAGVVSRNISLQITGEVEHYTEL